MSFQPTPQPLPLQQPNLPPMPLPPPSLHVSNGFPSVSAPPSNANSPIPSQYLPPAMTKSSSYGAPQYVQPQQLPPGPPQQQQQQQQIYGQQQHRSAGVPGHLLNNGTGNGIGSNLSSRTASPAHQAGGAHQPPQQQQQQQPPYPNHASSQQTQHPQQHPQQQFQPQRHPVAGGPPLPAAAIQQLGASMQNVHLNNGTHAAPPPMNGNFAAAHHPQQQQHQPQQPSSAFAASQQHQQQFNGQPPPLPQQPLPPPSSSIGTNRLPPGGNYPQPPTLQQKPPTPLSVVPNNNHAGAFAPPPPTQSAVAPPAAAAGGLPKRPAYPQQQQPQLQQQQQQQQFGYQQAQPLPQQQQPNYGMPPLPQGQPPLPPQHAATAFNGQPMSTAAAAAPLQYQQHFNSFGSPQQPQPQAHQQAPGYGGGTVQHGFNKLWGQSNVDLMQMRHVLPGERVKPPPIEFGNEFFESVNCSPDVLRCTVNKIPESNSLLQKSRLPLGILIHPFRDLSNLAVVQCSVIVRCRSCRTYINPFVTFVDNKKWRCNLCYRVNEVPEEFQYDPTSKSYGDVTRRPEVKTSTIEFIAPSEYMLRPPQPAIYLFLLDVSQIAVQSGYLDVLCGSLAEHLEKLPGDARTQVGFIAYNSAVHFYSIAEGYSQPHEITVVDIEEPFLPCPDNLLINLGECKELIRDLLLQLPKRFANSYDTNSALGAALQIAYKMMHQTGGRITVFQTCLPNAGPGALKARENPNERSAKDIQNLGPATDFYKRLALECSGQQIAVDMFLLNSQYSDLATLSGISKHSGGCMHHFPLFNKSKAQDVELFNRTLERYCSRKIGFESVMRVRCTRGLNVHTFHGNFFVRSTDLLSLPNVNPDAGFGMQISYDESLTDTKTVCFQAALLYTSSKGTRRIRVHTLCVPVTNSLTEVMHSADQQAIIGLISKMAVDRSLTSSIGDARDAFINAAVDVFSAFRMAQNLPAGANASGLVAPRNLALLPLYMMALLKHKAFRTGTSTRLDDRVFAMCQLKTLPLDQLMRNVYPDFYALDELFYRAAQAPIKSDEHAELAEQQQQQEEEAFVPALLQLSAEKLDSRSVFLLDNGLNIFILVGSNVPVATLEAVFGISHVNQIPDTCLSLPETGTVENEALHQFISATYADKPIASTIQIIRDTSPARALFVEHLLDDRSESSLSYYEFLQHLRTQVK